MTRIILTIDLIWLNPILSSSFFDAASLCSLMASVAFPSPSIHKILLQMEGMLMATFVLNTLVNQILNESVMPWGLLALLIMFAGLSFVLPMQANSWVKQGYVVLGMALVLLGLSQGLPVELFLYVYLIKSCFLLNRKLVFLLVLVSITVSVLVVIWALPAIVRVQSFWAIDPSDSAQVLQFAVERFSSHIAASIFVLPLSFMILAEQQSRERAEVLSQHVNELVAALERTRIARDIHDSLGHTLTALRVHLSVADRSFQRNSQESLQALKTAKILVDQSIEEIQQVVRTLRQPDFDLNQVLIGLMEQILQTLSLDAHWDIDLPPLPLQINHHLYCIVKEGLMNIQKHANASRVMLRGVSTPDGILIELIDNGQGFDPQATHSGFGLKGMAERVQLLGGQLTVKSDFEGGTRVQVLIPL
jgi:signal transduction histidine kinase